MPKVTILPGGWVVEASRGQTVMEAAMAHGLYWPTTCWGHGICTSCVCTTDGRGLQPMGPSERRALAAEFGEGAVKSRGLRLACQARVEGDVVVCKPGVRPLQPPLE